MKKHVFCLIALLSCFSFSLKAQTISVNDVEVRAGGTAYFSLNLTGGRVDEYEAVKFDIEFPTGFSTTENFELNTTAWKGATGEVGVSNVGFYSSNNISTSDVENLISIEFAVEETVSINEYEITLKNIELKYGFDKKDVVSDVTFKVNVVDYITLDENSKVAPSAASDVKVKVKRTINAGEWGTIVLPFDMTEEQVKLAFGDGVQLKDFTGYDYDEDTDEIKVNFSSVAAIAKNHPYIIKVKEKVSEFLVEGVTIDPVERPMVNVGTGATKRKIQAFVGTYVADFDFYEAALNTPFFLSGNQFWYASEDTQHMMAFRGYFDFCDVPEWAEEESRLVMVFDEQTGIGNVTTLEEGEYYDLKGQRVETPSKGIYIKDGKKVVVK